MRSTGGVTELAQVAMFELKIVGQKLVKRGIRPEFAWAEPPA
ncbi:hypothetical protein [Nonomuraea sp. LPB2021202275-12-8]